MVHDLMDVELIKQRVAVLDYTVSQSDDLNGTAEKKHTLETDAVKTTTS